VSDGLLRQLVEKEPATHPSADLSPAGLVRSLLEQRVQRRQRVARGSSSFAARSPFLNTNSSQAFARSLSRALRLRLTAPYLIVSS